MKFQLEKLGPGAKDRPLSKEELEFERLAEILPVKTFARIDPIPGTIGFLLRNLEGGNPTVVNYLRELMKLSDNRFSTYYNKFKRLVAFWDTLDDSSKRRIDLWDHVTTQLKIPSGKFIGFVSEGAYEYAEAEKVLDIISARRELFSDVRKFARNERNFKDRDLLAKATRLVDDTPAVSLNVNNTSQTVVNNNSLTIENNGRQFKDSIKRYEDVINSTDEELEQLNESHQRLLNEGETDYIDAELLPENEKELVRV